MKRIIQKGRTVAALLLALVLAVTALPMFSMPAFADQANLSFDPASKSVAKGETFTVGVMINVDEATRSAQLDLIWDPALLQLNSASQGTFYSDWATANGGGMAFWMAPTIDNVAGTATAAAISILGGDAGGPSGSGTLMTFSFTALDVDGISSLALGGVVIGDAGSAPFSTLILDQGSVTVGVPPVPDLVVNTVTPAETVPGSGQYVINYEISNIGNGPAEASTTKIYVNDVLVDTQPCAALPFSASEAGASAEVTLGNGDEVKVCADGDNVVAETNETNNCKTIVFSSVSATDSTVITGTIAGVIEITAPDDILGAVLQLGDNSVNDNVHVRSNGKYQVLVSDDDSATGGHMTQWDGSAYLSKKLINPVDIGGTLTPCTVIDNLANSPVLLVNNQACTGLSGRDHVVCFNQIIEWDDETLPAGHVYRIVVSFTAVQTGPCD